MKRVQFSSRWIPYLLVAPQVAIVVVFFYWPAYEAVRSAFYLADPFGFGSTFVGFDNFTQLFQQSQYLRVAGFTAAFVFLVALLSLSVALLLAVKADKVLRGATTYKTLIMWVYAVAPPVTGIVTLMLFDIHIGPIPALFALFGYQMKIGINGYDTAAAMIIAAAWNQIPINFIYFLSGLQSIPKTIVEAASIDCRSGLRRFWTVVFPLLAPTCFFLVVINITYALFDTFGLVDLILKTEPANNPITLVYKVYLDGFRGGDLGSSSAQSVILMVLVLLLTLVQFRFIERRVHYS